MPDARAALEERRGHRVAQARAPGRERLKARGLGQMRAAAGSARRDARAAGAYEAFSC